jgi:hypothetical protein
MKRNFVKSALTLVIFSGVVTLAGCQGTGRASSTAGTWGNFKCTALNKPEGGKAYVGWATSDSKAKDNAVDKCKEHSKTPQNCKIIDCMDQS